MTTMLEAILGTSDGEKMKAEAARKHRQNREKLAQALDAANALAAQQRKPLVEKKTAAEKEVTLAEQALAAARAKSHAAKLLLSQFDQAAERERTKHEQSLLDSAGEDLETFLDKVRAEQSRLQNWRRVEQQRRRLVTTGYSVARGVIQTLAVEDNHEEIGARIRALAEAAREAEHLASTRAEYVSQLETLWTNLPEEVAQ